jgi:hypothetical protein
MHRPLNSSHLTLLAMRRGGAHQQPSEPEEVRRPAPAFKLLLLLPGCSCICSQQSSQAAKPQLLQELNAALCSQLNAQSHSRAGS